MRDYNVQLHEQQLKQLVDHQQHPQQQPKLHPTDDQVKYMTVSVVCGSPAYPLFHHLSCEIIYSYS